jgi:hypothetical protein
MKLLFLAKESRLCFRCLTAACFILNNLSLKENVTKFAPVFAVWYLYVRLALLQ